MKFITRTITSFDIAALCFDKVENKTVEVTFSTVEEIDNGNALSVARDLIETRDKNLSVIMVNSVTKSCGLYKVSVTDFLTVARKVKDMEEGCSDDE